LPAGRSIIAPPGGVAVLGLLLAVRPEGSDAALGLNTSPAATALESVLQLLTWSGVGITTYHILYQMWIPKRPRLPRALTRRRRLVVHCGHVHRSSSLLELPTQTI
jgi:hypothetical protein